MKPLILIICLLIFNPTINGQANEADSSSWPAAFLKLDIINAFNPVDPSFLASVEYFPFQKHVSLIHEFGFVTAIRSYENVEVTSSFKTRHEIRAYLVELEDTGIRLYMGADFQYRRLTINERYVIGYECDRDWDCVYYQNVDGDFETHRYTIQARWGGYGMIADRFIIDFGIGIGNSEYQVDRSDFEGGLFVEENRFLEEDQFGPRPSLTVRVAFGVLLFRSNNK